MKRVPRRAGTIDTIITKSLKTKERLAPLPLLVHRVITKLKTTRIAATCCRAA